MFVYPQDTGAANYSFSAPTSRLKPPQTSGCLGSWRPHPPLWHHTTNTHDVNNHTTHIRGIKMTRCWEKHWHRHRNKQSGDARRGGFALWWPKHPHVSDSKPINNNITEAYCHKTEEHSWTITPQQQLRLYEYEWTSNSHPSNGNVTPELQVPGYA